MKLPTKLKLALEFLSGYSLDDVRVHYNSDKPKQINAKAYAYGKDIYLASGEEEHLSHEAWHIVQQKQGRVTANKSVNGILVNDDPTLEKEASLMGNKAKELITSGFKQCITLLNPQIQLPVAQLTTKPDEEVEHALVKIVHPKHDENSSERQKSIRKVETQEIVGVSDLNKWLNPNKATIVYTNELAQSLINKLGKKKPLPYYKYLKSEKSKFLEKWQILNSGFLEKVNRTLAENEAKFCFGTKTLGLGYEVEANENRVINKSFKVSRPVEALYLTPYVAMYPFTEEFNYYQPKPGKLGLRPIGINSKTHQIICATSAMASLCGFIQVTDNDSKAQAGAIAFMKATHKDGKQVNAASIETARGFAIGLAAQQGRIVSPIFKPLKNERGFTDSKSANALNELFWCTVYPKLKVNAAVYCYSGKGHVASLLKQDNNTYLWVESNNNARGDRAVHVKEMSAKPSSTRRHLGDGFLISQAK
ncbi:MAG: DUF4157 domain-containing protein [Marinomonas sp.]